MAATRFTNPFPQFFNSTPAVYSGGFLYFYAAGTSTPLDTYSDNGLTSANSNPITLNSAGRAAVNIYLQNAAYKVVLKDSAGNEIWTADNYNPAEYAVVAQFTSYAGNPNGNVAGTAASSGVPADSVWDRTNNILYVCTTTGNAASAVWTAINATSTTTAVTAPQGRLTLTSGTPVLSADALSQTTVYYTPYAGNQVPLYNGASTLPATFSELSLPLASQHVANTIYDVFVFSNSGALTLVTGPAWTTITPGSCARGTGAGTTQLTKLNGFWVNAVQMTARNGSTTYTVDANKGTYVGSIYIDNTAGQCTYTVSHGQNRKCGVWNAYNREPIVLQAGDATASWTNTSATTRASRNVPASHSSTVGNYNTTASNSCMAFTGLAEESVRIVFGQSVQLSCAAGGTSSIRLSVGLNSVTAAASGNRTGRAYIGSSTTVAIPHEASPQTEYILAPTIGVNGLFCLEEVPNNSTSQTFYGTSANMVMTAMWLG